MLRDLLRRGLVKMTDLRDDPEWFFEAHRIIGTHGEALGSGFWTRFTVQFNLFAGTVLAVGDAAQVQQLDEMQRAGDLGCFALTEKFAGVSSGLVVETVAEFDPRSREFVITSPDKGAVKNWISQGCCADKSVLVAQLRVDGHDHGPHAFLIDFRVPADGGRKALVAGVRLADMGRKTVANDLDNAWIAFDGVRVPESALLSRHAAIDRRGAFVVPKGGPVHTMEQIGQRLFTGRVAVAQARARRIHPSPAACAVPAAAPAVPGGVPLRPLPIRQDARVYRRQAVLGAARRAAAALAAAAAVEPVRGGGRGFRLRRALRGAVRAAAVRLPARR